MMPQQMMNNFGAKKFGEPHERFSFTEKQIIKEKKEKKKRVQGKLVKK